MFKIRKTYGQINSIVHFISSAEIREKGRRCVFDTGARDILAFESGIVTDGRHNVVNNKKFGFIRGHLPQFGQNSSRVGITPVVQDLTNRSLVYWVKAGIVERNANLLNNKHGSVLNGLSSEKVVWLEINASGIDSFGKVGAPKLQKGEWNCNNIFNQSELTFFACAVTSGKSCTINLGLGNERARSKDEVPTPPPTSTTLAPSGNAFQSRAIAKYDPQP